MKNLVFLVLIALITTIPVSANAGKGGVGPCLATCIFGDTRIGLEMNEGKEIQTTDFINLVGSFTGIFPLNLYTAYDQGYKNSGATGCCVAMLWGNRAGRDFKTTKLRTKEIMMCVPGVCIIPAIMLPLEAMSGKTYAEVIEEEQLKR